MSNDFKAVLSEYLAKDPGNRSKLAGALQLDPSSLMRWALSVAPPHTILQTKILEWIKANG